MRLLIVAVGQRQPAWVDSAVDDYLQRFPSDFAVTLKEVKPEPRSGKRNDDVERLMSAEAERLRHAIPAGTKIVALDERGKDWTTQQLAQGLQRWRDAAEDLAFVIGGPDGLHPSFKQQAAAQLRLSSMTLPHGMARVLLAEQLYRAWSILSNHPYHRV